MLHTDWILDRRTLQYLEPSIQNLTLCEVTQRLFFNHHELTRSMLYSALLARDRCMETKSALAEMSLWSCPSHVCIQPNESLCIFVHSHLTMKVALGTIATS